MPSSSCKKQVNIIDYILPFLKPEYHRNLTTLDTISQSTFQNSSQISRMPEKELFPNKDKARLDSIGFSFSEHIVHEKIHKKKDLSLLEEIVLSKLNNKKEEVNIERKVNDKIFNDLKENINDILKKDLKAEKNVDYSLELTREKKEDKTYSVFVEYEQNSEEEKFSITLKPKDKKLDDYSVTIVKKNKEIKDKDYSLKITYHDDYKKEKITVKYKNEREKALQDFSDRVPGKTVHVFPESMLGGVLGFTYLGENFMGKREDMIGDKMVDIHESIHTHDEYETRVLTSWIMSKEKKKYFK